MSRRNGRRELIVKVALVLLTFPPAFSQTPGRPPSRPQCALSADQSPAIRGIRLGMSAEQVLALFPGSGERPEVKRSLSAAEGAPNYGVARLYFQPSTYPSPAKEKFAGIDSYLITLFDGRVTELTVRYNGNSSHPRGPFWKNVDDFVDKVAQTYKLPDARGWERRDSDEKVLTCADHQIVASTSGGVGEIRLFNSSYIEKVKERAAADEERLRREFKP